MQVVSESTFRALGAEIFSRTPGLHDNVEFNRKYIGLFGVSPLIASMAWDEIRTMLPEKCVPRHLLWGCLFLKVYGTETVHSSIVGTDPKTFRKWSWLIVKALANLKIVRLMYLNFHFLTSDRFFGVIDFESLFRLMMVDIFAIHL